MSEIKFVKISPFYCGCGWYDYLSGINFVKTRKNEPIRIPDGTNLTNIRKYLAKNLLIDVSSQYDKEVVEAAENKEILARSLAGMSSNVILKEEAYDAKVKEPAVEAPVEETKAEEATEEIVAEEPIEVATEEIAAEQPAEKAETKSTPKNKKSKK